MFKASSAAVLIVLGIASVSCAPRTSALQTATEELSADVEVRRVIADVANHIDAKRWPELEALYSDQVETDYTSLFGGTPQSQSGSELIAGWKGALGSVTTQHHLGPITVEVSGTNASAHCSVRGHHFVEGAPGGSTWMVAGSYDFKLQRGAAGWRITHMTLNTHYQTGNKQLLQEASNSELESTNVSKESISFESQGSKVVGDLYLPVGVENPPAVVVAGSWTTVKEQMAGTYAKQLAERGFAALAIDARGYGQSEGQPRFYESPERKIEDYKQALAYLRSRKGVDGTRLGAVGVCAGAGYIAEVAAAEPQLKAVGFVASWLHDGEAVKLVYGGEKGVKAKIDAARAAKAEFEKSGTVAYIPTISETDPSAAMYGPFAYYLDPERGAVPQWSKQFAVMSWQDWLTFNPLPAAPKISAPALMIHSDDAVLPDYAKGFFKNLKSKQKRLHWTTGSQFDFYDQPPQVTEAVEQLTKHFRQHL